MRRTILMMLVLPLILCRCGKEQQTSDSPTGYPSGSIQRPQVMYNGTIYYYQASGYDKQLPSSFELVGSIEAVDNDNAPIEDWHGCLISIGQNVYADENSLGFIYIEYESGYAKFVQ